MPSTTLEKPQASRPASSSGKTCQASSQARITHSETSLPDWLAQMKQSNQVHDLSQGKTASSGAGANRPVSMLQNGQLLVVLMDSNERWPGEPLMPNTSEWPNDAAVVSLSQVLEKDSIPSKYLLSSTACAGILRRAVNRGRLLPPSLKMALESSAQTTTRRKQDT